MFSRFNIKAFSLQTYLHIWRQNNYLKEFLQYEKFSWEHLESLDQCIYKESMWKAVRCQQFMFKSAWRTQFEKDLDIFINSATDFYNYTVSTLRFMHDIDDMIISDKVFISCAFVSELVEFHSIRLKDYSPFALGPNVWALYFELELLDEFSVNCSLKELDKLAQSYNGLYVYLETIKDKAMQSSVLTSMEFIVNEILNYKKYVLPRLDETQKRKNLDFLGDYMDFYNKTKNIMKECNFSDGEMFEVYAGIETLIKRLRYLCDPLDFGCAKYSLLQNELEDSNFSNEFAAGPIKNNFCLYLNLFSTCRPVKNFTFETDNKSETFEVTTDDSKCETNIPLEQCENTNTETPSRREENLNESTQVIADSSPKKSCDQVFELNSTATEKKKTKKSRNRTTSTKSRNAKTETSNLESSTFKANNCQNSASKLPSPPTDFFRLFFALGMVPPLKCIQKIIHE